MAGDIIKEASRLISSSVDEDVERFGNDTALTERINEWLETPIGSIADKPEWGHILSQFKHDPIGPNLEVAIEMAIAEKLPIDIADLVLLGVGVESLDIDLIKVVIRHQFGQTVSQKEL